MQTVDFNVPTMYGDHHVLEVRRILLEVPGVIEVYASSSFHVVEVIFDENKVNDLELQDKLKEAGYFGEWIFPMEVGTPPQAENGSKPFFRHTEIYESTRQTVSFAQNIGYAGRPLWPCPGMGVVKKIEE